MRSGPIPGRPDLEIASALTELVIQEFTAYGTDGSQRATSKESRELFRALAALAIRLGITFNAPFSDFDTFRAYWVNHDGYGSWHARRMMVAEFFGPLREKLEELEDASLVGELVTPVTPAAKLGWPRIDEEIQELRRHFHTAQTIQDYRNVGNDCIAVLEALSVHVYDHATHTPPGEPEPPKGNTKTRLDRYIDHALKGPGNAELRGLARKTIEFAQAVKHNPGGTRMRAGIAADAVIQLANVLRRLADGEAPPPA